MEPATNGTQVIPPFIYCPKCGETITIEVTKDPFLIKQLAEAGYDAAGRGSCKCGVEMGILHRPLPESPSFEILVNVYKREG